MKYISHVLSNLSEKVEKKIIAKIKADIKPGCKCNGECHSCRKLVENGIIAIKTISTDVPRSQEPSNALNMRDYFRPIIIDKMRRVRELNAMKELGYPQPQQIESKLDDDDDELPKPDLTMPTKKPTRTFSHQGVVPPEYDAYGLPGGQKDVGTKPVIKSKLPDITKPVVKSKLPDITINTKGSTVDNEKTIPELTKPEFTKKFDKPAQRINTSAYKGGVVPPSYHSPAESGEKTRRDLEHPIEPEPSVPTREIDRPRQKSKIRS